MLSMYINYLTFFTIIDLFHLTWFDHYIDPDKWGGAGRT